MDVFTKDLGVHQGRIPVANAPEGAFVYELGHALLQDVNVNVGDYHEVSQTITVESLEKVLRASIVIVTPAVLPFGAVWQVSAWLNGTRMIRRIMRPSKRTLILNDWVISMANGNASPLTNLIAFRLELL